MSYFEDHYPRFRYPLRTDDQPGFRLAQLGAIHAAAAHFAVRTEPGIITMPTGSGKTAVLLSTAFVLRAKRVLIIAPGRLVREQIAEEATLLKTLRRAGAVEADVEGPRVYSTKKRIKSVEQWEALRDFDIVVGTVPSISPEYPDIPKPPADLFDLVLIDEAHHSPARTWQAVFTHFSRAKRVLFTATPFRQDQREINGRFIFTYDLRAAFADGVFGEIRYNAVVPAQDEITDVAVAKAAERQLHADQDAGFRHRVMVRTDNLTRADQLAEIYREYTNLRLSVVTSRKSLRSVKKILRELEAGTLDGIICVNMLGEGFDFPSLKIAAIHSPHRSLSVTLQFIGRFARTGGENLGPATFLAVPSEIKIEAERLYDTRSVWQEVVENLSATRVHQEAHTREVLETFSLVDLVAEDLEDLSLYVLEPYYHVKVYQLDGPVEIDEQVDFPAPLQVVYKSVSEAHRACVYITREISLPRWTNDDRLSVVKPDLFIFHQDLDTNLLFICASRRSNGLYDQLSSAFAGANPRQLALVKLNRALNDLEAAEFFNVGMRNRVATNTTESYRIITGSSADKTILKSDGRLYHRGHVFGRASDEGAQVTIGLSSASKVWSNKTSRLPEFIAWCGKLATRIASGRTPQTGTGVDHLDVGIEIEDLPDGIIAVDWPIGVYKNPPMVRLVTGSVVAIEAQLLDFDFELEPFVAGDDAVFFRIRHESGLEFRASFSFETDRYIEPASTDEPQILILHERDEIPLINFLNDDLPCFYTADLGMFSGASFISPHKGDPPVFELGQFETVDWAAANVDITREFGAALGGAISVHAHIEAILAVSASPVVYYDHGTGEIADFVEFAQEDDLLLVRFFHCKGSGGAAPGHRVDDVYEIVGQVVKSAIWAQKNRVLTNIRRRFTQNLGSARFVRGDLETLTALLEGAASAQIIFEFVAVQPGLRRADLPPALANLLAGASDHLSRGGFRALRVIGSA